MSDERDFLTRWSRRKHEARDEEVSAAPAEAPPPQEPPEFTPEELETLSDAELCERLDLPDPETLEQGDDFSAFLQHRVPERLKRIALRRLWRSNPIFGNLDGLNEYDEDFRAAASSGEVVRTMYRVGKGYDRPDEPDTDEMVAAEAAEDTLSEPTPENAAPQEVYAESPDSAGATDAKEESDEESSPIERAPDDAEYECDGPPQITSRRMSFRFVEKSNTDE